MIMYDSDRAFDDSDQMDFGDIVTETQRATIRNAKTGEPLFEILGQRFGDGRVDSVIRRCFDSSQPYQHFLHGDGVTLDKVMEGTIYFKSDGETEVEIITEPFEWESG